MNNLRIKGRVKLRLRLTNQQSHLLPIAKEKLREADDDSEMFDGELREAIEYASKAI
jgi:hypothetical protein